VHYLKRFDQKIFWSFIVLHVACWTLLPTWTRLNLPMDSIEGVVWAQKLSFGYDKAPLLNAWVTSLVVKLVGYADWGIYLVSQICVMICFIALWQLAKKMLQPMAAVLSILILECFQYYNVGAIDFDDNVLQLPLWALSCLFFYKAITEKKEWPWIWLGVFTGLALLAKYYAVLLLSAMLVVLLLPENRHFFRERGVYLAAFVCLSVITPHVVWLFQNDFLTIHYVFRRVGDSPAWINHLANPLFFLRDEAYALIVPSLLLMSLCFPRTLKVPSEKLRWNNSSDVRIMLCLGLIPLMLAVLLSLLTGIKLHIMWGSALFSLWGILFMLLFSPQLDTRKVYRFLIILLVLFFVFQVGYILSIRYAKNGSSAHFPGRAIAYTLTKDWHQRYKQPLSYVVGSRWLTGNLAFYSGDHPVAWIDADSALAPTIDLADLKCKGALFIWDTQVHGQQVPKEFLPFIGDNKAIVEVKHFAWQTAPTATPVQVKFIFVAPSR
jgi:4-amino-4-deoxy-L-arabinose transferase-like glycosyltransferase